MGTKHRLAGIILPALIAAASLFLYYMENGKVDSVAGIELGETWVFYHNGIENRRLQDAVNQTLNTNPEGLKALPATRCDTAGCYDLGAVITQIIYRMGEDKFAAMLPVLDKAETNWLADMITVGLEYGGNVNPRQGGARQMETEFPKLHRTLSSS